MPLQTRFLSLINAIGADVKALQLAQVKTFAQTLATSATSYVVTHGLGTRDVQVQLYSVAAPYAQVWATVQRTTVNTVTIIFAEAPAASQYRVVVQGRAN